MNTTETNSFLEIGLSERIFLTGLALCFRPGDRALSVAQIISRRFAPSEQLCRDILALLIRKKLINGRLERMPSGMKTPSARKPRTMLLSFVHRSQSGRMKPNSTLQLFKILNPKHAPELEELLLIVLASECVEYSLYLADRLNIALRNTTIHDKKLQMLLLNNTRGQVLKLIWQAINTLADVWLESRQMNFADLIDECYSIYNSYLTRHYELEVYNWPKAVKHSYLSNLLIHEILRHRGADVGIGTVDFFTRTDDFQRSELQSEVVSANRFILGI